MLILNNHIYQQLFFSLASTHDQYRQVQFLCKKHEVIIRSYLIQQINNDILRQGYDLQ